MANNESPTLRAARQQVAQRDKTIEGLKKQVQDLADKVVAADRRTAEVTQQRDDFQHGLQQRVEEMRLSRIKHDTEVKRRQEVEGENDNLRGIVHVAEREQSRLEGRLSVFEQMTDLFQEVPGSAYMAAGPKVYPSTYDAPWPGPKWSWFLRPRQP